MKTIKKAVIPVAGLGTRFLPATKVVPKELLPIVDKPSLQYVVEEAVSAGLAEIILVTNPVKTIIEEHFSNNSVYDDLLKSFGKHHLLADLNSLNKKIEVRTVMQNEAKGLGHAVLCAKEAVGDEWFVVLLPDMLIDSEPTCTAQMIDIWKKTDKGVIATGHAPRELISQYGIIAPDKGYKGEKGTYKISDLVEKPRLDNAPSDLYIIGRYLLPPTVFGYIEKTPTGAGGEIQITDALRELAKKEGMLAVEHKGTLHDTGNKLEYLKANIHYALKDDRYGKEIKGYLRSVI